MDVFNEKVVKNLKNEVECLNYSLAKAREDGNFSMYKNLINSYRETLMLINELSGNSISKSSIIQTPEKIVLQVGNGKITNENNDILIEGNRINIKNEIDYLKSDEYKTRCAIEKEIENKINYTKYKDLITEIHAKMVNITGKYDITIKTNIDNEDELNGFTLLVNNIIINMALKEFINMVILADYGTQKTNPTLKSLYYNNEKSSNMLSCGNCGKEFKKEGYFYKINQKNDIKYPICKHCLDKLLKSNDCLDENKFKILLDGINIPFDEKRFRRILKAKDVVVNKPMTVISRYLMNFYANNHWWNEWY
ncbi:TPA: hypothetical protein ACXDAZ_002720 [Clostridium botulinum]|uniref:hypothetical protein n=1 Tax=Clostridium botulinum TaxID=1491 RepID=UPI001748746D|nr:hypothetical protein [Clostridium botulinum]MBD5589164.1 hypothetical protein [Clostridium botulinum]